MRGANEIRIVACVLYEMANEHSSMITERCLQYFDPALVIGVGIAGSLDNDVLLGDVVVSRTVENVVFESKAVPHKDGYKLLPSACGSMSIDAGLYDHLSSYDATRTDQLRAWRDQCKAVREALGLAITGVQTKAGDGEVKEIARDAPQLIVGAIASGPSVGAAAAYVAELKSIGRDFRALEMEGAGIARACQKRGLEPSLQFSIGERYL
jgi:nucleoside phosphorylase